MSEAQGESLEHPATAATRPKPEVRTTWKTVPTQSLPCSHLVQTITTICYSRSLVCHRSPFYTLRERDPWSQVRVPPFRSRTLRLNILQQPRYVIANDLSNVACEAMRRNVELNDLHEKEEATAESSTAQVKREAKIRVNEGDAWCVLSYIYILRGRSSCESTLMYNHRAPKNRVDVVDLDPYGTAAPFIDAAVQCVNDGGKTTLVILLSVLSDDIPETRPTLCHLY